MDLFLRNQHYALMKVTQGEAVANAYREEWERIEIERAKAQAQSQANVAAPAAPRWPWGSHESDGLTLLAEAGEKFWSRYDPNDPETAPQSQQVIDWLKARHPGLSENRAQAIASILRPSDLPRGPKPSSLS